MRIDEIVLIEGKYYKNPNHFRVIYDWDGLLDEKSSISIPTYVETNSLRLRKKYLEFVDDLGYNEFQGKKINDELLIYKEHSLWWMSSIVEKNLVSSPSISDCIKLLALEELFLKNKPKVVHVYSLNGELIDSIKKLTDSLNIKCIIYKGKSRPFLLPSIKQFLPSYLKGIAYLLKQCLSNSFYLNQYRFNWHDGDQQIFLFSQFINFKPPVNKKQPIYSFYWESLPSLLYSKGIKMNYLNHFYSTEYIKSIRTGIEKIKELNDNSVSHNEIHQFVTSYLDFKSIFKVFIYFNYIHLKFLKSSRSIQLFKPKNSSVDLWFFLKEDWYKSIFGTVLIENLLFIEAIECCLKELPKQKLGVYLQENFGWERAFIKAWKKYQNVDLIGVPHTVIRYWDLRYFEQSKTFNLKGNSSNIPLPDYVAVNGPIAENMLLEAGYNSKVLVQVEALRYLNSQENNKLRETDFVNNEVRVLVCGDIDVESTTEMLYGLKQFINTNKTFNSKLKFFYKSHPINNLDLKSIGIDHVETTSKKINEIIYDFDIAIVTDSTSAGVEAYLAGLSVIVFSYPKRLNFSPLRGLKNVSFVRNAKQLIQLLNSISSFPKKEDSETFFWSDPKLPKWSKLLSNYYNL
jgi:surface carbohydrate biosynthesis protein (TIGR04326 family)